jgi:hypothetical protein
MVQKHRISTNIGKDQKVTVELKQDYDLLEILSLKFSQVDVYRSLCSDYGVVVGRISANNGFGIPNARVSIFIPLAEEDVDDPVISALYPYTATDDTNDGGYRYNLLPSRRQHGGHEPTGTFPDQLDILTREEVLEVYEKYYKYTVKTNESGDFMIWGVPVGQQTLHVDVDLSDIGCFSLRPDDFIAQGAGPDQFMTTYKFKSSPDISSLPQIITFEQTIEVVPFWGNVELCEIGLTRTDFDLTDRGIEIQPKAYIIGGTFSDTGKNSINKNCNPRKKMGRKCMMTSEKGIIETIRFTSKKDSQSRPILEEVELDEDIDETGSFMMSVDMNMDYLITNEFGENEYSNDPNKGIPTSAVHRFRFTIKNESLGRVRTTASYLVPNIKEHASTFTYPDESTKSYAWSTNYDDYPFYGQSDILNNVDGFWYPQDYFYRFTYNKVYTVSSFHGSYEKDGFVRKEEFLGIKEIVPTEEEDCDSSVNTFPVNFAVKNYTFALLISDILLWIEHFLNIVKLGFFNIAVKSILRVACAIDESPTRKIAARLKGFGFDLQERGQKHLYLIIYPECDECTGPNEANNYPSYSSGTTINIPCSVGTVHIDNPTRVESGILPMSAFTFSPSSIGNCAGCTDPNLDIVSQQQNSQYYLSGYTSLAYFIDNQNDYGLYHRNSLSSIQGAISGTSVFWKSYTYNFSPYFNDPTGNTLSIIYDGTGYPITIPTYPYTETQLKTAIQSGLSSITSFGPAGATVDVFLGGDFEISPNSTKVFGNATVVDGSGSNTISPSIFTSSSIVIDYTNVTYFDEDSDFADPSPSYPATPTGFTIEIKLLNTNSGCTENDLAIPITVAIESGCEIYDTPYNEGLISLYVTSSGSTSNPDIGGFGEYGTYQDDAGRTYVSAGSYIPGTDVTATIISDISFFGFCDSSKKGGGNYYRFDDDSVPLPRTWNGTRRIKITQSGVSEFSNGVFYIVPGSQSFSRLISILQEYRKRKRVAKMFCGGIANYSFINNWLSGSLYFFAFKAKNKRRNNTKYCTDVVKWITDQSRFYYKSCRYVDSTNTWGSSWYRGERKINRPTTFVDLGPRDEFIKEICTDESLDPNCSVSRQIGPTSFKSFGEIQGLNINYRLDVTDQDYNLNDFFDNTGFAGYSRALNGDVLQLISINNEVGIEEFDLQNPKYLGYSYQILDPEFYPNVFSTDGNGTPGAYMNGNKPNGPLPITFDLSEDGERIRACLNEGTHVDYSGNTVQGRLTESSQPVPFYLWEKNASGFGDNTLNQHWDFTQIETQPLQGMTYAYSLTGAPNDSSDQYLLLPMTYTFPGETFTGNTGNATNELPYDIVVVSPDADNHTIYDSEYPGFTYLYVTSGFTSGTEINAYTGILYTRYGTAGQWDSIPWNFTNDFLIRRTENYYNGSKQILSTPFLFYFGLRPGNTGLDKFIERFGPTGVFPTQE